MKLIVITQPTFFVEEDKIITALFEEGLDILHLRKPGTAAMYSERLLTLIPEKYHRYIVTHEHFYLKQEFGLMGIHLNARNPQEPNGYSGHVSCSCHTFDELREKKKYFDYVFLSPVFDSISKTDYRAAYPPEELRKAAKAGLIDKNVIALGGVCADNLLQVKDFGFGGAVVLGDIWGRFDPCHDTDYRHVIDHFVRLKRLAE
ncbi:MAG: thiamine phosphate synthase [Bacteroidaceae bacterium]